ncbi:clathrin assembly protein [Pyrus ussuriensis x Pyrus communis]|uniref:Clathrin assembly protein n=1 Tax=Pyrus ussuriensis x Pyrus communis TaxID=2448454 RepID=A0A5N5H006_9ROSA|nr:clathrin assembly protein [Pyrus ussuriensis x Pyrus communis]
MKLWKKAAGLIKDRNSIWVATISRRTSFRNPDLEAIIIKATSHDEATVDYKNFHRVYQWVRTSPLYLKPLLYALSTRMEKTHSWVVALKGLMLMHGIFCCKILSVQKIGRLPFDLSNFCDKHSKPSKTWAYDAFVRAYFTYLDQRSAFLSTLEEPPLLEELGRLQKWQSLLDMLLEIKPEAISPHRTNNHTYNNKVYLISEAMICLLTEIFDVYSRVCKAIAGALLRIYAAPGKQEAQMALGVVQKAGVQGEELSLYLEYCMDMGILSAADCPKVEQIPEEDIRDLERIINQASKRKESFVECDRMAAAQMEEDKAIVPMQKPTKKSKTIITDKWEVFEEDLISWVSADTSGFSDVSGYSYNTTSSSAIGVGGQGQYRNPFAPSSKNIIPYHHPVPTAYNHQVLPDLISF